MKSTPARRGLARIADQWGLALPPGRGWRWMADEHLMLAAAAALPALFVIAAAFGPAMHAPAGWKAWASFVLVQPVLEELVFRGIAQGELLQWTGGRKAGPVTQANLWTSLGFTAAHFLVQPPAWALAVAVPSLVFGHLRDRLRSAWPAVVLHGLYNLGFALAAAWARSGPG